MLDRIEHNWRTEFKRLEGAYAPSTIRSYFSDVGAFEKWSYQNGRNPFPASVDTVCDFLAAQALDKSPSTVRRRLYAIRKAYRLLHLDDPTHDEEINITYRRIRRAKLTRPRQAKGLTRDHLDALLAVQPETPLGMRNKAMLSLGYDLLTRRSELVALMTDDISWCSDGTLRVLIRRSKSDPFGQGRVVFTFKYTALLVDQW